MKYLKLIKEWSGLGGADCLLCETKRKDWKDVEQIQRGFPITSVAEETKTICHQLVSDDGEIKKAPHDYSVRKGLTEEPLTTSNQHHICITHYVMTL